MTFSVTGSVDRYVSSQNEERKPDQHWHPSSLFGCKRAGVYTYLGTPKSNPPGQRSLRIFRLGHLFHDFIQEAIEKDEEVTTFYREVKIYDPDLNITGHADGLIQLASGRWIVLEFKSIGGWGFKSKALPMEDHKGQARTYANTLKHYGGRATNGVTDGDGKLIYDIDIPPIEDLDTVRFCYISKETGETKEYDVQLTDASVEALGERVGEMDRHVREGTLPDRLPFEMKKAGLSKNYLCESYCDYRDMCWAPAPQEETE